MRRRQAKTKRRGVRMRMRAWVRAAEMAALVLMMISWVMAYGVIKEKSGGFDRSHLHGHMPGRV